MSALSGAKVHIYSVRPHKDKSLKSEMSEVHAWMAYPSQSQGLSNDNILNIISDLNMIIFSVDLNKTPTILSQITGKEYNSGETTDRYTTTQIAGNDFRVLILLLIVLIIATLVF